jgi:hypothetical protein
MKHGGVTVADSFGAMNLRRLAGCRKDVLSHPVKTPKASPAPVAARFDDC